MRRRYDTHADSYSHTDASQATVLVLVEIMGVIVAVRVAVGQRELVGRDDARCGGGCGHYSLWISSL